MSNNHLQSQRAMTLVEVAVAATVVLVGVVGLIQALTIGSAMLETSRNQTVAGQIMQNRLNQVRLLNWNDIANLHTEEESDDFVGLDLGTDSNPGDDYQFKEIAGDFTWRYYFSSKGNYDDELPNEIKNELAGKPDLVYLKIAVQWTSKVTGRIHTRTTETYLSKNGLHAFYQRS